MSRILPALAGAVAVGAAVVGVAWHDLRQEHAEAVADAAARPAAVAISAGTTHTCAVTAGGGVRCWGANADWQLGNGVRTWSRVPVDTIGLSSGVASVSAGGAHSCALSRLGAVLCWGLDPAVLAFPPAAEGAARPVPAEGLSIGVVSIGAGNGHTCALTDTGAVRCWGVFNRADTSKVTVPQPTDVPGLTEGVRALGVGYDDQCAVTAEGAVRCWGQDYEPDAKAPVLASVEVLPPGTDAAAIGVGGSGACVLTGAGGVRCWSHPGTPDGPEPGADVVPAGVPGLGSGVVALSVGYHHACALTRDGAALCWGHDSHGELGDGGTADSAAAVPVAGLGTGVAAVSAGFQHSCALRRDGQAWCWGWNFEGQLGNGASTISSSAVPLKVAPPKASTPK